MAVYGCGVSPLMLSKDWRNVMTKREETYIDNLHKKFATLLDGFMNSSVVEYGNKEPILNDLKFVIDERIRELHNEDLLA